MSGRIKILSVFHEIGWAGDESRTLSMSRTLDRERFEHMVITILDPSGQSDVSGFREREKQYRNMGVDVRSLSTEIPDRIPRLRGLPARLYANTRVLRRAMRLARFARKWGANVIDARTAAGFVGVLAGKMGATPTSITYYGPDYCDKTSWTARLALRLADRVLTDSEIRAKEFRAKLRESEHKVIATPNGIPEPESVYRPQEARRLFGLPEDPRVRVVGQIGRLINLKGQTVLLRAAKDILDHDRDVAFLIVGYANDQPYREGLNRLAHELGITNRVRIVSYPGLIGDVWRAIDIHVHPSLLDSQPISIIEGMSLGKPAVVTSVGGIPEIVEHGRTGLIIPPGDSTALSVSVLELLRNRDLATRLGDGARERYEQRHRPEMMTQALEAIFVGMVNRFNA